MLWPFSIISLILLIRSGLASPYLTVLTDGIDSGESVLVPSLNHDQGDDQGESLRDDCARLIRLYNRLHSQSGAYSLLAEGQIDGRVLDACARLLISPGHPYQPEYDSSTWMFKRDARNADSEPILLQRRGYDYIRFGKRLVDEAKKRMSSSKTNKNASTHEYIRFGKK